MDIYIFMHTLCHITYCIVSGTITFTVDISFLSLSLPLSRSLCVCVCVCACVCLYTIYIHIHYTQTLGCYTRSLFEQCPCGSVPEILGHSWCEPCYCML